MSHRSYETYKSYPRLFTMTKCPFCQFENEEGALFCEQCKSDLGAMEPVAAATPVEAPYAAVAEAPPIVTPIVMEASVVESPATLAPMETAIPVASPLPE